MNWLEIPTVGYVDESGDMMKDETHVLAGVFFASERIDRALKLARSLRLDTPDHITKKGKKRWPKAIELPEKSLEHYAEEMLKIGTVFVNQPIDKPASSNKQFIADSEAVAGQMETMFELLNSSQKLILSPQIAIEQFKIECKRHPTYMRLLYYFLVIAAKAFHIQQAVPRLNVCFDDHFQPSKHEIVPIELVRFLLRWLFYVQFKDQTAYSMGDVFGLTKAPLFTAYFSSDSTTHLLYLADVYAHSWGMHANGKDPTGKHGRLIARLESENGKFTPREPRK